MWKDFAGFCCTITKYVNLFPVPRSPGVVYSYSMFFLWIVYEARRFRLEGTGTKHEHSGLAPTPFRPYRSFAFTNTDKHWADPKRKDWLTYIGHFITCAKRLRNEPSLDSGIRRSLIYSLMKKEKTFSVFLSS